MTRSPSSNGDNMSQQDIEALLIEREGYLKRGLKDRVKQVDEALKNLGHKVAETASVHPDAERAMRAPTAKQSK